MVRLMDKCLLVCLRGLFFPPLGRAGPGLLTVFSLVAAHGLCLVAASEGLLVAAHGYFQLLWARALSSCGTWGLFLWELLKYRSMASAVLQTCDIFPDQWSVPALPGGFSTTRTPGKSSQADLRKNLSKQLCLVILKSSKPWSWLGILCQMYGKDKWGWWEINPFLKYFR